MGIFSDEDINEADELAEQEAGRTEFLKGFENGWKEIKRGEHEKFGPPTGGPGDPVHFITISIDKFKGFLQNYEKDFIVNHPREFGYRIGQIIGVLKFDPLLVLYLPPELIINMLALLKSLYPKYYDFIVNRFKRWNKVIKTKLRTLEPPQIQNYQRLIRQL